MNEMEDEPNGEVELETSPSLATRFVVRRNDKLTMLRADDVDWVEGASNYVNLHVKSSEYRLRVSIRSLMERLDPAMFVRIHKSTIVNVDRIREVQPWFSGDYVAILQDGRQLRVSRTFAPSLLRPIQ
jgi:Response regulator of the LytR/AlgR family